MALGKINIGKTSGLSQKVPEIIKYMASRGKEWLLDRCGTALINTVPKHTETMEIQHNTTNI